MFWPLLEKGSQDNCRLCLGFTGQLIKPCRCALIIHTRCLTQQISKQLKYKDDFTQLECLECGKPIKFRLHRHYRCRTSWELGIFFIQYGLIILCGVLNEQALNSVEYTGIWSLMLRIYLTGVGIYLWLVFLLFLYVMIADIRSEFMVPDHEPSNIILQCDH